MSGSNPSPRATLADELRTAGMLSLYHSPQDEGSCLCVRCRAAAALETKDAALKLADARITATSRAFYGAGTSKALRAAFAGWIADAESIRSALALGQEGRGS